MHAVGLYIDIQHNVTWETQDESHPWKNWALYLKAEVSCEYLCLQFPLALMGNAAYFRGSIPQGLKVWKRTAKTYQFDKQAVCAVTSQWSATIKSRMLRRAEVHMRSRAVSIAPLRPSEWVDSSTSDSTPSVTQIQDRRRISSVFTGAV